MTTSLLFAVALAAEVPTPAEEQAWLASLEASLDDGHALLVATGLAHHTWTAPKACEPGADAVAWRARAFLDAWRAIVVQNGEVAERLKRFQDAETVAPLRSVARRAAIQRALDRTVRMEAAWRGSAEWHRQQVAPYTKRCAPTPAPAEGWPEGGVRASDDPSRVHALWAFEGGWLCSGSGSLEVAAGVALTEADAVCLASTSACDCTPAPVLAGASIGLQPRE
ncbi:MAG: hypothetical protein H6737_06375 [Alphaproteobacteria bacterium]|nr:hypothetical protein [Alphaproteobacteria bacterium]